MSSNINEKKKSIILFFSIFILIVFTTKHHIFFLQSTIISTRHCIVIVIITITINHLHRSNHLSNSPGVCPVLCSQRGEYINGECQCNPGWKGKECSLRHDECEVPDCNGHGHCVSGKCQCIRGYKGKFCEDGKFKFVSYIILRSSRRCHILDLVAL